MSGEIWRECTHSISSVLFRRHFATMASKVPYLAQKKQYKSKLKAKEAEITVDKVYLACYNGLQLIGWYVHVLSVMTFLSFLTHLPSL